MSHAPTCNLLNIHVWQLAICIDHVVLYLVKDAIGKELSVSLNKLAFQPCSTPAKPVSSEAFSLLMINQKSAFQANQGFTGLLSLTGFDIRLRKSFMTKSVIEMSAPM